MVELDPYDVQPACSKRTALGRFAHESAAFGLCVPGQPLAAYMGDDSRGEYIYKFVSDASWSEADAIRPTAWPPATNTSTAAACTWRSFNADGSGQWIELTIANPASPATPGTPSPTRPTC